MLQIKVLWKRMKLNISRGLKIDSTHLQTRVQDFFYYEKIEICYFQSSKSCGNIFVTHLRTIDSDLFAVCPRYRYDSKFVHKIGGIPGSICTALV